MRLIVRFMRQEATGGVVLFLSAFLAMVLANSSLSDSYLQFFRHPWGVRFVPFLTGQPLLLWINEGLMSIFFFLVGLELRQEWCYGTLNRREKRTLPFVAAMGGMLVPALFYVLLNHQDPFALRGWAIPTATDIAFALGVLSLLGRCVPVSLKVFLTTIAIFDDIGAITIIAFFYTDQITWLALVAALCFTIGLWFCKRCCVQSMRWYALLGGGLWLSVLNSGIHATLAGFLLAILMPLDDRAKNPTWRLKKIENRLHPWVALGVLPLFALANSGVPLLHIGLSDVWSSVPLGILLGLFLGKPIGIVGASALAIRFRLTRLPPHMNWSMMYGLSVLCGIGFTMSLFIGALAFDQTKGGYDVWLRLGVLLASLVAGLLGYGLLRFACKKQGQRDYVEKKRNDR